MVIVFDNNKEKSLFFLSRPLPLHPSNFRFTFSPHFFRELFKSVPINTLCTYVVVRCTRKGEQRKKNKIAKTKTTKIAAIKYKQSDNVYNQ